MLGKELRAARQAARLTQEELGFEAGLSRNYISLLEKDQYTPTIDVLFRLCDALGIRASELIDRIDEQRNKRGKKRRPQGRR